MSSSNSIEDNSREFVRPAVHRNVVVPGDAHEPYTGEAPRKKLKAMATFPNDPRVIHKTREKETRKRFNGCLIVR